MYLKLYSLPYYTIYLSDMTDLLPSLYIYICIFTYIYYILYYDNIY